MRQTQTQSIHLGNKSNNVAAVLSREKSTGVIGYNYIYRYIYPVGSNNVVFDQNLHIYSVT